MSLSVRIVSNDGIAPIDRHLSRSISGLSFRKVAGGGCADAQLTINLPRAALPNLGPADRVVIYDQSTGTPVWDGAASNPGAKDGPEGQSFDLNALGSSTILNNRAEPLTYTTSALDSWAADDTGNTSSAAVSVGTFPDSAGTFAGKPGIICQFNSGQPVGTGLGKAAMMTKILDGSTMRLASVTGTIVGGSVDTNYRVRIDQVPSTGTWLYDATLGTAPVAISLTLDGNAIGLKFILQHTGAATNVATDDKWAGFSVDGLQSMQYDTRRNTHAPATAGSVTAQEVVTDMCGRLIGSLIEPNAVSIEAASGFAITELAYPDAARMGVVLDDLARFEPDMTYEVTPANSAGRFGFRYRSWGTTARYEISTSDGYSAPGADADLCNRIAVGWTDSTGVAHTTVVTASVPELGAEVKDAEPATLPAGVGSHDQAVQFGRSILGATNKPPTSATAVVDRPVLDMLLGRMIPPYLIEPGYLVRVRETGDDLRLTEVKYDADEGAATLTLGDPVYDTEQRVAALSAGRDLRSLQGGLAPAASMLYDTTPTDSIYTYS